MSWNGLEINYKEIVIGKYADAFAYETGTSVRIKIREYEQIICRGCGRPHLREKKSWQMPTIGSGKTEELAWQNAAEKIWQSVLSEQKAG